jgi:hypothetical protein
LKLGLLEKFVGRGQLLKQRGFERGGHRWGLCHRGLKNMQARTCCILCLLCFQGLAKQVSI